MSLFITCPVESVERATAFYTALGWTLNSKSLKPPTTSGANGGHMEVTPRGQG